MSNEEAGGGSQGQDWQLPAEKAIPKLVGLHGAQLYTLGSRLCGDPDEAQDLVQETFLQAFASWHQFRGDADPKVWLYTIAARTCNRFHRKRSGEPAQMQSLEELLPLGAPELSVVPADSVLDECMRREALQRIEQAIVDLPTEFRMALVLKEIVGFTVPQVARVLDIQEGTAKTRVHRARLKLRLALDKVLPREQLPPTPYSKQVCMDLLHAKQESLDRGVAMPEESELLCARCEAVFSTLDLAQDCCRQVGETELPAGFREALLDLLAD